MEESDYREVLGALDMALTQFLEKPVEVGFDLHVYEQLRRARETLIRAQRDMRDSQVPRGSRSPLGSPGPG